MTCTTRTTGYSSSTCSTSTSRHPAWTGWGWNRGDRQCSSSAPAACPLPQLTDAQVTRSTDPELAQQYALRNAAGRVGPGYALVDASGRLRYRTFDPRLALHEPEIQTLVAGLP